MSGTFGMLVLGSLMFLDPVNFATINGVGSILIGVGFVPLSALFAQRAHDLGWSAFIPLVLFAILAAPMFTAMDYATGVFGYGLARVGHSIGLDATGLLPLVMIGNGLWMLFAIHVAVRKGQPQANRFGSLPALA